MLWISLCSARVERLHEPLRDVPIWLPAGDPRKAFRHLESALRNARSATGASVGLSVEKLFAFPVEKCLRRSWERRWTGPQDFSRLAKEPGKRRCGMRHDGASRNCGQWIHPWRRRACFRRSPRTFLKSRKTQYSWASWRRKGSPGDIFTGIPVPRVSCGKAVGKLCRKRAAGAAPGIRPSHGLAGRDRSAGFLRTAVDILWIKLLAKCWRKCLARSRPWPAGLAVFCPAPMLRKLPGRSAREASQGPGWAPDTLWITL